MGRTSNSDRGDRGEDTVPADEMGVDFLDAIGVVTVVLRTSNCTGVVCFDTAVVGGLLRLGDVDGLEVSDELLVTGLVTEGHPDGSGVLTSGVATGCSGAGFSGAGFVTSPLGSN